MPLLRLQHEFATRGATAAPCGGASRGFSSLSVSDERPNGPHADPDVLHKGFGSFRRPFARFLEGAILDRRAGARTRHNRYLTVSKHYIRPQALAGKGKQAALSQPGRKAGVSSASVNHRPP